jgi:predicted acetyltransferase
MAAVSPYQTRVLDPSEYRTANDLFQRALLHAPSDDETWQATEPSYEPGRVYGTISDGEVVGTAQSYRSRMAVPGGVLPTALVTRVGVRADHTRRGVLTGLMRAQLESLAEPLALLHASEAVIYGRFGYGMASRERTVSISRHRAALRPGAPEGGRVRMLVGDELWKTLPDVYEQIGVQRPGWVQRPGFLWSNYRTWFTKRDAHAVGVVHTGPDGDDGFAVYSVHRSGDDTTLRVIDLQAGSVAAWAALLRYLLGVDLVHRITLWGRPVDDPVEWVLTDYRAALTEGVEDESWLRLVDVPTALAARSFSGPGSVVIEVRDELLPANSGRYLVSADGATRTDAAAQLVVDVDALASLYLGDVRPSTLALAGRITVLDVAALSLADGLFTTPVVPWTGSGF